jgi:hypothetical protein
VDVNGSVYHFRVNFLLGFYDDECSGDETLWVYKVCMYLYSDSII